MRKSGLLLVMPMLLAILSLTPQKPAHALPGRAAGSPGGVARSAICYRMDLVVESAERKGSVHVAVYGDISEYRFNVGGRAVYLVAQGNRRALHEGGAGQEMGHALGLNLPDLLPRMSRNYDIRRTAGEYLHRPIWREEASPRYPGNPSRVTIYDRSTGVILMQEDRDRNGMLLLRREANRFEEIPCNESERRRMAETLRTKGHNVPDFMSPSEARPALGFTPGVPRYVPKGYGFLGIRTSRRLAHTGHAMFSNGIGIISLYSQAVPWWARRDSSPHAGRVIEWEQAGIHYVLVGDVETGELLRMAQSVPR